METIVFLSMALVCFNYLLKQTERKPLAAACSAAVCALFTGAAWPWAVAQSRTQIADYLADPSYLRDAAVLLTFEAAVQMAYCLLAVQVLASRTVRRRTLLLYRALRHFPGILIYPVLFSGLVAAIFALPGCSFPLIAWSLALGIFALMLAGRCLLRRLLPERELRLELLFLSNALIALVGIIATVDGRTAAAAGSAVDWGALAGLAGLTAAGAAAGALLRRWRLHRTAPRKE